jgi:hypothetical protein
MNYNIGLDRTELGTEPNTIAIVNGSAHDAGLVTHFAAGLRDVRTVLLDQSNSVARDAHHGRVSHRDLLRTASRRAGVFEPEANRARLRAWMRELRFLRPDADDHRRRREDGQHRERQFRSDLDRQWRSWSHHPHEPKPPMANSTTWAYRARSPRRVPRETAAHAARLREC